MTQSPKCDNHKIVIEGNAAAPCDSEARTSMYGVKLCLGCAMYWHWWFKENVLKATLTDSNGNKQEITISLKSAV